MNKLAQIVKDMLYTAFHKVHTVSLHTASLKNVAFLRESGDFPRRLPLKRSSLYWLLFTGFVKCAIFIVNMLHSFINLV